MVKNLSFLLEQSDRPEEALLLLEDSIRVNPGDLGLRVLKGTLCPPHFEGLGDAAKRYSLIVGKYLNEEANGTGDFRWYCVLSAVLLTLYSV